MVKSPVSRVFYNRIPKIISVIFHPLLMPTIGILLLLYAVMPLSLMSAKGKQIILSIVFLSTFLLPLALLSVLYFRRMNEFIKRNERRDRILPLIYTSVLYYLAYYFLHRMGAPFLIQVYLLAAAISVACTFIISAFWKISAHLIGIGGFTALIVILMLFYRLDVLFYFLVSLFLSGLVGFARLSLNAHTPVQVYTGFGLGFICTIISFLLL